MGAHPASFRETKIWLAPLTKGATPGPQGRSSLLPGVWVERPLGADSRLVEGDAVEGLRSFHRCGAPARGNPLRVPATLPVLTGICSDVAPRLLVSDAADRTSPARPAQRCR